MSSKIKIDEEIKNLGSYLNALESIHPDYTGLKLKKLQGRVLTAHAHLEEIVNILIGYKIAKAFGRSYFKMSTPSKALINLFLQPLLNNISFRNKIEIIEKYKDIKTELIKALRKVNGYRNEFAHPKGSKLREKYKSNSPKGKQNIRDLFRCLVKANNELNKYFSKIMEEKH